jgi:hypothetical protein
MSLRISAGLGLVLLSTAACSSYQQPEVAPMSLADQVASVHVRNVPPIVPITPTYWPDNQAAAPSSVYRAQQ